MRRSFSVLVLMVAWLSGRSLLHPQAQAQSSFQALTYYAVTVYSGPDRAAYIVGILMPQAKVILESRNADTTWVLGHSTDGTVRAIRSPIWVLPQAAAARSIASGTMTPAS